MFLRCAEEHKTVGARRNGLRAMAAFLMIAAVLIWTIPALAEEPKLSDLLLEIKKLREEVQELRGKVAEFEKKEATTQEKVTQVEKKAEAAKEVSDKMAKKAGRDRLNWGGEFRVRMVSERAETTQGFYGAGKPSSDRKYKNEAGFPMRLRLNFDAQVVPDMVDLYGRLTINKRFGTYATWPDQDPLDSVNSFHSGIGSDVSTRVEHIYAKFNAPKINSNFYAGRLAAMDGPPARQNSPFPRVFIDSEVDGVMWEYRLPDTSLDKCWSPLAIPSEGTDKFPVGKGPLGSYGKKVKEGNSLLLAYAKHRDMGFTSPKGTRTDLLGLKDQGPDTDVYIAQGQLKLARDTVLVVSGLYMPDWYMPRYSFDTTGSYKWSETYTDSRGNIITIPYFTTYYSLVGAYLDTQIWKFQVYGAAYFNEFSTPAHGIDYTDVDPSNGTTIDKTFPGEKYNGHAWWVGMNTGDAIAPNQQFCVEYFRGEDNWINPLNYRGFRRKGTVLNAANNYYYNPSTLSSDTVVVGFYPVNARIWDIYYDYYLTPNCRFRLGYMDFKYDSVDRTSPIGASGYERHYWPYLEVNLSF
ncbi:MAG: hypothetical protein AB1487_02070 [Thermodesulfobacteriota bacterium]